MTRSVSLLVPGLAAGFPGYAADSFASAPALSRALSRSQLQPFPAYTLETAALSLFGVRFQDRQAPVAPFACLGDTGRAPTGYCLCADPVHLRADTHGLVLFDTSTFSLSDEDSQALLHDIADFLEQDGWQLEHGQAGHWYLHGENHQDLITTPMPLLRGKPVADFLPRGGDAPVWRQRFNEIQMLMHAHPVNRQRVERGLPLVNSLWFWGGGMLPAREQPSVSRVVADNVTVKGLGDWSTARSVSVPDHAADLLSDLAQNESVLVTLEALDVPAAYQDFGRWNAVLERYERNWFEPLLAALATRRLSTLEVFPVNGQCFSINSAAMLKFWKRARSYRDVLSRTF